MNGSSFLENKSEYKYITVPPLLDAAACEEIIASVNSSNPPPHTHFVVDFALSPYLYSSGIGFLIRLRKSTLALNGTISLVNINKKCRDMLTDMHLEAILPMFATDVEFEISQTDLWATRSSEAQTIFLCTHILESGICRINLCGSMALPNSLASILHIKDLETSPWYIFDMTGLDLIDSHGMNMLLGVIEHISMLGGHSIAYGLTEVVRDMFDVLSLAATVTRCADEAEALALVKNKNKNPNT